MNSNYILLTAIVPQKKNTVIQQLEVCILSILRLNQNLKIFVGTNNRDKIIKVIKNNKFNKHNIVVKDISKSKKNYISNHKLDDFKFSFGKIQCLRVFLESNILFNKIIISDIDTIFSKRIDQILNKNFFLSINYYADQDSRNMKKIFSLFLKNFSKVYWISSGFMLMNSKVSKKILQKIDQLFPKFIQNGVFIKKTINHYGDEILFTLASNSIHYKKLNTLKNYFSYNPIHIIWTGKTKKNIIRFLNPFKLSAHVHLPDIKYDIKKLKLIKIILLKANPNLADLLLYIWLDLRIFKNKIIFEKYLQIKKFFQT